MSRDVDLRDATIEDVPTLLGLVQTAFEQYRGRLDPPSGAHRETVESIRTRLTSGGALIATVDGEAGGCAFYTPGTEDLYLDRLSVLPRYRGLGVARALVAAVESRADGLGLGRVRVGVRLVLDRNRSLFESLGYSFVALETHAGYAEPTGVTLVKDLHTAAS